AHADCLVRKSGELRFCGCKIRKHVCGEKELLLRSHCTEQISEHEPAWPRHSRSCLRLSEPLHATANVREGSFFLSEVRNRKNDCRILETLWNYGPDHDDR